MQKLGNLYLASTVGVLGYHGVTRWQSLETKPKLSIFAPNDRDMNDFLVNLTSDKFYDSMIWPVRLGQYYHVGDRAIGALGWTLDSIVKCGKYISKLPGGKDKSDKPPGPV